MAAFNHRRLLLLLLLRRRRARRTRRRISWVRERSTLKGRKGGSTTHSFTKCDCQIRRAFISIFEWHLLDLMTYLLSLVGPAITHQHTNFRTPTSPGERLAVTLRFLATGDSMQTVAFSYRLGHSTVCAMIKDTCDALWNALAPEYL